MLPASEDAIRRPVEGLTWGSDGRRSALTSGTATRSTYIRGRSQRSCASDRPRRTVHRGETGRVLRLLEGGHQQGRAEREGHEGGEVAGRLPVRDPAALRGHLTAAQMAGGGLPPSRTQSGVRRGVHMIPEQYRERLRDTTRGRTGVLLSAQALVRVCARTAAKRRARTAAWRERSSRQRPQSRRSGGGCACCRRRNGWPSHSTRSRTRLTRIASADPTTPRTCSKRHRAVLEANHDVKTASGLSGDGSIRD